MLEYVDQTVSKNVHQTIGSWSFQSNEITKQNKKMSSLKKEIQSDILDLLPEHKQYMKDNLFDAFFLPDDKLIRIRDLLNEEINLQLHGDIPHQLYPSYIEESPDGTESGKFLAVDIGGTHCRVLLVDVHNGKTSAKVVRGDLPAKCHTGSGVQVFDFIAEKLHELLTECELLNTPEPIQLGFTFSFPINIISLDKAVLINWTKDYHCNDVIGMEVGQLLEDAIKRRGDMNIKCCAIINDATGTLMCGAFIDKGCKVGLICGTGTNACCFESIENCVEYKKTVKTNNKSVALDLRWNNFGIDKESIDFIRSSYDWEILTKTTDCHMGIERMLSGMFIGEVVRQVLLKLYNDSIILKTWPKQWESLYSLHTEFVCNILRKQQEVSELLQNQGLSSPTGLECRLVYGICQMVVIRAAELVAAMLACTVNRVEDSKVGVAVDGSVYKNMELFRDVLEEKTKSFINPGKDCYFVPCEDGSGLGAAIVASMVDRKLRTHKN